ncbi:Uu.00g085770.m01.CDS01 [Anthostomella pinea]|uniref:Uu.00g085770.m01.CDS01 n=1 Tax=Anthostomella pinea TaxID=933095 RepID=A0AAI8VMY5_9PEZI|nr:Uu.00g085770.m01.CDS01 [Anthostomella pinea]
MLAQIIAMPRGHLCASFLRLFVTNAVYRFVWDIVYNLYFHPLRKYPGPLLARASNVCFSYWFHGGRQPYKILDLHPVVRIAPNDLAFNSAQSWPDIYRFRQKHKTFVKGLFYEGGVSSGHGVSSVETPKGRAHPAQHQSLRRGL